MNQLIECVPNFSEGCDSAVISAIANEIKNVSGVKLLNIDPGKAANRTVITFAGTPEAVVDAAFLAIKKAADLIDMSKQKGEHPRIGATDVCPLVPISGITLEETAVYAKRLGERVGKELNIPIFLYEAAQTNKNRSNLAVIRKGEYEGMFEKIKLPEWIPDYGPAENSVKSGATVIGARNFLIAYNINLNTSSVDIATAIATEVRETGHIKRKGNLLKGEIIKDEKGNPVRAVGKLKSVKAIGWFIKEYECAQVSMNLTDMNVTPIHIAFEEVCASAKKQGVQVTGSELIGLIPLKAMLEAGTYFLKQQQLPVNIPETAIIDAAVWSLKLNYLSAFIPEKRILEYLLRDNSSIQ
jgi:glutamate formiminotransferase/formiminotetrahydrofolate cyclodeaminase